MRIILLGPPGSGKGTQAKLLSRRLGLAHISTGDILRQAIQGGTPLGRRAEPYVTQGRLVPDDLVNEIVASLLRSEDCPRDFVLDGYPRTVQQAQAIDVVLTHSLPLDAVVFLDVDDQEIVQRLAGRWNCPACRATYNSFNKKPKTKGVCDDCGATLVQRDDDKEETVRNRIKVFHEVNSDLLAHYAAQGLLLRVAGKGDIDTIYQDMERTLKAAR